MKDVNKGVWVRRNGVLTYRKAPIKKVYTLISVEDFKRISKNALDRKRNQEELISFFRSGLCFLTKNTLKNGK